MNERLYFEKSRQFCFKSNFQVDRSALDSKQNKTLKIMQNTQTQHVLARSRFRAEPIKNYLI